jgi:hypothetical protein
LKDYRQLGGIRGLITEAERQLEFIGSYVRQNQVAVDALRKLKRAYFTDKQIEDLVNLVSAWGGENCFLNKPLDTDLVKIGSKSNRFSTRPMSSGSEKNPPKLSDTDSSNNGKNLQQPNSSNSGENGGNNGYTMADFIKLNFLSSANSNMLNKLGGQRQIN